MFHKITLVALALTSLALYVGCSNSTPPSAPQAEAPPKKAEPAKAAEHGHKPGKHGGLIAEIGRDNYHAEVVFEKGGNVKIYTLGKDESRILDVEEQTLSAHVQGDDAMESVQIELKSVRQPDDDAGKTSLFVGQLPAEWAGRPVTLTARIKINGERFRFQVAAKQAGHGDEPPMPGTASDVDENDLYLTPGGKYTMGDIAANGSMTATQKFRGVRAKHDLRPKTGDRLCPITLTKASANFTWFVGGEAYQFCCPPCVREFVLMAKEQPEEIKPPDEYVKK